MALRRRRRCGGPEKGDTHSATPLWERKRKLFDTQALEAILGIDWAVWIACSGSVKGGHWRADKPVLQYSSRGGQSHS